jgi:hypothetical protein
MIVSVLRSRKQRRLLNEEDHPGRYGRPCCSALAFLALLGLLRVAVQSQTTSTEILGLVTDTTGAVVPGARVTITRLATGETRSTFTSQSGEYIFRLIGIGEYTVRCERQGFKTETVTGLQVQIQQKARVDLTLEVARVRFLVWL